MQISKRLFDKTKDYEMFCNWCEERQLDIMPLDFISDYGIISSIDGTDVACAFLYPMIGVSFCMLKFPIANPNAPKEQRDVALNECFHSIHSIAKKLGYNYVFCATDVKPLQERLVNNFNYIETNQNCNYYWSNLCPGYL